MIDSREASKFGLPVARWMCVALDRVDVQHAAKDICREMSAPRLLAGVAAQKADLAGITWSVPVYRFRTALEWLQC